MNTKGLTALARILSVLFWLGVAFIGLSTVLTTIVVAAPGIAPDVTLSVPLGFAVEGSAGIMRLNSGDVPIGIDHAVGSVGVPLDARGLVLILWAGISAGIGLALVGLKQLQGIVGAAAAGKPFVAASRQRLRRLGWVVIVIGLGRAVYLGATYAYAVTRIESTVLTASLKLDLGLGFLLSGALLLAFGEIFGHGADIQTENDLTV